MEPTQIKIFSKINNFAELSNEYNLWMRLNYDLLKSCETEFHQSSTHVDIYLQVTKTIIVRYTLIDYNKKPQEPTIENHR